MGNGSKHTPGPWAWGNYCEEVSPGAQDCCELVAYGPPDINDSRPIFDILHLADDCSISEANARLIAAAPEMLEALRDALRCCYEADIGGERDPDSWMGKAAAAIAKAEGAVRHG